MICILFSIAYKVYGRILIYSIAFACLPTHTKVYLLICSLFIKERAKMIPVSLKIDACDAKYLTKIAHKLELIPSEDEPVSLGKALKKLLQWCNSNDVILQKNNDSNIDNMQKMVEQIHACLPNIAYLLRLNFKFTSDEMSPEMLKKAQETSIEYCNKMCGDFANTQYSYGNYQANNFGMLQLENNNQSTKWSINNNALSF